MKPNKRVQTRRREIIKNQRCNKCRQNELTIIKIFRLNYPFGLNSKPRRTLLHTEVVCYNKKCVLY